MVTRNTDTDLKKLADAYIDVFELRDEGSGFGVWGVSQKAPFGNSSVNSDILDIIGWDYYEDISNNQYDYVEELYSEHLGDYLRKRWKELGDDSGELDRDVNYAVPGREASKDLKKLADVVIEKLDWRNDYNYGGLVLHYKFPIGDSNLESDILKVIGWEELNEKSKAAEEQENYARELWDDVGNYIKRKWKELNSEPQSKKVPPIKEGNTYVFILSNGRVITHTESTLTSSTNYKQIANIGGEVAPDLLPEGSWENLDDLRDFVKSRKKVFDSLDEQLNSRDRAN